MASRRYDQKARVSSIFRAPPSGRAPALSTQHTQQAKYSEAPPRRGTDFVLRARGRIGVSDLFPTRFPLHDLLHFHRENQAGGHLRAPSSLGRGLGDARGPTTLERQAGSNPLRGAESPGSGRRKVVGRCDGRQLEEFLNQKQTGRTICLGLPYSEKNH